MQIEFIAPAEVDYVKVLKKVEHQQVFYLNLVIEAHNVFKFINWEQFFAAEETKSKALELILWLSSCPEVLQEEQKVNSWIVGKEVPRL